VRPLASLLPTVVLTACVDGASDGPSADSSPLDTAAPTGTAPGTLQWVSLGLRGDTADVEVYSGVVGVDGAGHVLVAYAASAGTDTALRVDRLDDTGWMPLGGGPVAEGTGARFDWPALVTAPDGTVVLCVEESDPEPAVQVYTFDGATWTPLPPLGRNANPNGPALAVDAKGRPHVLMSEDDDAPEDEHPRVFRWDGEDWAQLGGDLHPSASSFTRPGDLAIRDSQIVAAVVDGGPQVADTTLRLMSWDGGAWSVLGDAVDLVDPPGASWPRVALTPDGIPWVTFRENLGKAQDIHVARYEPAESGFVPVGGRLNAVGDNASYSQIAIDDAGTSYVAWREEGLRVSTHDGTAWSPFIGEAAGRDVGVTLPSMVLDRDGRPVLAYAAFTEDLTWHVGVVRAEVLPKP